MPIFSFAGFCVVKSSIMLRDRMCPFSLTILKYSSSPEKRIDIQKQNKSCYSQIVFWFVSSQKSWSIFQFGRYSEDSQGYVFAAVTKFENVYLWNGKFSYIGVWEIFPLKRLQGFLIIFKRGMECTAGDPMGLLRLSFAGFRIGFLKIWMMAVGICEERLR